jgi:hypothetical protein
MSARCGSSWSVLPVMVRPVHVQRPTVMRCTLGLVDERLTRITCGSWAVRRSPAWHGGGSTAPPIDELLVKFDEGESAEVRSRSVSRPSSAQSSSTHTSYVV